MGFVFIKVLKVKLFVKYNGFCNIFAWKAIDGMTLINFDRFFEVTCAGHGIQFKI